MSKGDGIQRGSEIALPSDHVAGEVVDDHPPAFDVGKRIPQPWRFLNGFFQDVSHGDLVQVDNIFGIEQVISIAKGGNAQVGGEMQEVARLELRRVIFDPHEGEHTKLYGAPRRILRSPHEPVLYVKAR